MKNVHKITIKLEKEEWKKLLDETFKEKNKETTIKGFRKGKAPKEVFIKKFGIESLFMDAADKAYPIAYRRVLDENKLEPVVQPKVDIKNISEEEIELEFEIITKPEVKVKSLKNLGVKKDAVKVTKDEINKEIDSIRGQFAEIIIKEKGKAEKGDIAVIDFEGFVDDKPFEGGQASNYELELGSNTFIPGFEDGVVGMKIGETKDIKVKFPDDYVEHLKGKDAVFKVTVNSLKTRVLPEINEELFKDMGYDKIKTKEELEEEIKKHLKEHKENDAENKYIDELLNAGIEKMEVELNEEIINDEVDRMIHDLEHNLSHQGITLDLYLSFNRISKDEFIEKTKPEAIKRIKSRYLIDYIIEKEGLKVTDKEVEEHAEKQAKLYGTTKEELITGYGGLHVVEFDLLVHKAIDTLKGEKSGK